MDWNAFLETVRRNHSLDSVLECITEASRKRILVIGETIVDEYHYVRPMGKSPKGNLIATQFLRKQRFMGGILAVANHVAGLSKQVTLISCLGGQRSFRGIVMKSLKPNVSPHFCMRPDASTTLNTRFVDDTNHAKSKLLGVYYFNHRMIPDDTEAETLKLLRENISHHDIVLAVDYGHGFFTKRIIEFLCEHATFLALNVQTNSTNFGFNLISKFPRADYICLDELEARLEARDRFGPLDGIAHSIAKKMHCGRLGMTLGKNGALIAEEKELHRIPARPADVVDTVGTGDAYLAITTPCAASGVPADLTGFIGSVAGSLASTILCNEKAVDIQEVQTVIQGAYQ